MNSVLFNRVCVRIFNERCRQEQLLREGKFPFNCADRLDGVPGCHALKLPILVEEVGEVAKEVFELSAVLPESGSVQFTLGKLRDELTQVAATAIAWLESMEEQ